MGMLGGTLLRVLTTFSYVLAACSAGVVLAIYSYFLSKLSYHHLTITNDDKAIEGLSGAAVLYTMFCFVLTCFLGGIPFFAFIGIVLDIAFCGAFIAIAVLTRTGVNSCNGYVYTPLGNGFSQDLGPAGTHLSLACHMNQAVFAVSIIGAALFLICAGFQLLVTRHHQKEKKYGPSPANDYTSGSGNRGFFSRKPKVTQDAYGNGLRDQEMGGVNGVNGTTHDTSYTAPTATTAAYGVHDGTSYPAPNGPAAGTLGTHGGYHTAPTGTAVNPYGYNQTHQPVSTSVNY